MRVRSIRTAAVFAAALTILLLSAAGALAAGPATTIGGVPAANETGGTFTFSAPGATAYRCSLDDSSFAACTSPLVVGPLPVGTHNFKVYALNASSEAGAVSSFIWTIDLTPPSTPVVLAPVDGFVTSSTQPTFSGTAEAGARVLIFDGPDQIGSIVASGGSWSITVASPLSEGVHSWRARAADAAGNLSGYTALRLLTVDTTAPAAPTILAPVEGSMVNRRFPVFSGTGEPAATVVIDEGSTRVCSAIVAPGGSWQCTAGSPMPDGDHQIAARAIDAASNTSDPVMRGFSLDATPPPAPSIDSPPDGLSTTASAVTVEGTGLVGAAVSIFLDDDKIGETAVGIAGTWSFELTDLEEGDYMVTARQEDENGNLSAASNSVDLRIDRTAPVVSFTQRPNPESNIPAPTFKFSTGDPVTSYQCALDGADWSPCANPVTFGPLADGAHALRVRATDAAGNAGGESRHEWVIDTIPPVVTLVDPPSSGVAGQAVSVAFTYNDGGATPECSLDGSAFVGCSSPYTTPALSAGDHLVSVRARDAAGNFGQRNLALTITPTPAPPPGCTLLGAAGAPKESVRIAGVATVGRELTLAVESADAGVAHIEIVTASGAIGSVDAALLAGSDYPSVKLKRSLESGEAAQLRVRFITGARDFGESTLALVGTGSGVVRAAGAKSTYSAVCPAATGSAKKPKLSASGKVGSRSLKLSSATGGPALVLVTVRRGSVIADGSVAVGAGRWSGALKLSGKNKLARGKYTASWRSISTGRRETKGSFAFSIR
ncbi:MAG: Ig-like domain-containing protein [Solirubrobacterales bacterium]